MVRVIISTFLVSCMVLAGTTHLHSQPLFQGAKALAGTLDSRSVADASPIKWELVDSTAIEAKRPHIHYQRVKVPKIVAYLDVARVHGRTLARFVLHWAPKTVMHITRVHKPSTTERLLRTTDHDGLIVYYFYEPDPAAHHHTTVVVRAWGVFAHHRRTVVLRFRLGPTFPPASGITTISAGLQNAVPVYANRP